MGSKIFASDSASQDNIWREQRKSLRMHSAQIGIFKQVHNCSLASLV